MADAREKLTFKLDPKIEAAHAVPEPISPVIDAPIQEQPKSIEQVTEERRKKKALIVTALERGVVHDRLHVDLPPDVYGEWVRRDPFAIAHMERLGFKVDTEYAINRSLHSDGTGKAQVADVVFMTTTRENKELIDEVKHERFLQFHAKPGKKSQEEKDLEANVQRDTDGEIPTLVESKQRSAQKEEIAAALGALNQQTSPQR